LARSGRRQYRRLVPDAPAGSHDADLAVSAEVNPEIAAAINANPRWFWHGPGCVTLPSDVPTQLRYRLACHCVGVCPGGS
jgi:hypothetical protein